MKLFILCCQLGASFHVSVFMFYVTIALTEYPSHLSDINEVLVDVENN